MNTEYQCICDAAVRWVRQAGFMARDRLGSAVATRKADKSPVTDVDHAVQDALLDAIGREHPRDSVICEETIADPGKHAAVASGARCWVIDPIDGTRNYARSLPVFTVSVALLEEGAPVVGIVFDPIADRMYTATTGGGAWLADRQLAASDAPLSGDTFLSVPTGRHEILPPVVHDWVDRLVVRNFGSTALHLAYLAEGALDAVYARRNKLWDIAAGALLVTEAGGQVRSIDGRMVFPMDPADYRNEEMPFLAGGPAVLTPLLEEYRSATR
jgi:myo-inositol-1(or 4)-monophosphatase